MAIGDSAKFGYHGHVGVAKETTYGTKVDSFSDIEYSSESLKLDIERKNLEVITNSRNYRKRVSLNKTVSGSIEGPLNVASDGIMYIIRQALGGTVSSTQIAATGSYNHTCDNLPCRQDSQGRDPADL